MAIRKKLVDRVVTQVAALPTDQFIVLDVTDALLSCSGKPLASNDEVCAIMRCYGLAKNTGVSIKRGKSKFTVWEKIDQHQSHKDGKASDYKGSGVQA